VRLEHSESFDELAVGVGERAEFFLESGEQVALESAPKGEQRVVHGKIMTTRKRKSSKKSLCKAHSARIPIISQFFSSIFLINKES